MVRQAAQAESRSSLATRLPKTDLLEKNTDAAAAHCRKHGSFAVNLAAPETRRPKRGMLSVDRVSVRRSEATLARSFSLENAEPADAYSGVQSSAGRDGRGSIAAPSPRAPQPRSHCATAMFCSTSTPKRGTFLIR